MGNAMQNFGCRENSPRHFTPARRARPSRRTELSRPRSPASQARHAAKTGRAGPQASRMKRPVPYWAATTSRPAIWADQLVSTKRLQSATTDKMSKILSPRRAWWSFYDHNQAPWPRDDTYSALSRTQSPHIGLPGARALGSENRALVALGRQGTWKSFFQRSFFPWCRGL